MLFPFDHALSAMLSNAPVAMAVYTKEMVYVYHTLEWRNFFDAPTLIDQKHSDLFPDTPAEWNRRFERALGGEAVEQHVEPGGLFDNKERYFDSSFRPWFDSDSAVGGVVVVLKDVTSEHLNHIAITEAEQRFERATTAGGIGIFEYRPDSDTFFINSVGMEMLSLSPMEFDNINLDAFKSRLAPAMQQKFTNQVSNCLHSNMSTKNYLDCRTRDNTPLKIELQLTPLIAQDRVIGLSGVYTNVTHTLAVSYEAEEALLESEATNEELKSAQDKQRRMFAVIGHEVRTPAAALSMLIDTDPVVAQSEQFPLFKSTIEQLLSVLDELGALAQSSSHKVSVLQADYPGKVVSSAVHAVMPALERAGISVHLDINKLSNTLCHLNVHALQQILTNLLRNCEIHSGATQVWVMFHAVKMPRDASKLWCQLVVSDNGRGIPLNHQDRVFEPFYRVDESRDGAGIGLSLCQTLSGELGGVLSCEERQEGGAQFILNMMMERADEASLKSPINGKENRVHKVAEDVLTGKYILVAEDNKTIQAITKAVLMKAGAKVAVADHGKKALEIYSNNQLFDFVLTDIFMPQMDGYELTQKLREAGFDKPIIGITAATIGEESEMLIQSGANAAMAKPLNIQHLRETLHRVTGTN